MLIICTFTICMAICIAVVSIIKISKSDNGNIIKNNYVPMAMLSGAYIFSFITLYVLFKEYNNFDMFKYLGICSYWLFAGVTLFSFLNLVFFSKKNSQGSIQKCTTELVKKLTLVTIISILWVISNALFDKPKYIIFSVPAVMVVLILVILIKFILIVRTSDR